MAAKSEALNSNSKLRFYKQNMMLKFLGVKSNESKLTGKEISKQLGFSNITNKRYTDDIQMDCPYKRNKYKKKDNNQILQ